VVYADDIVLLSHSCRGLQNLVSICERYGLKWDIKFNPGKSQASTFGGTNPSNMCISLANTAVQWTNKVKYLGLHFFSNSGHTEVSDNIRKFYGQYNNIRSVLGYGSREMCTVHLCKVFCLPTLMYGCESWRMQDKQQNRISVAWNNSFRSIFNCCWRESVSPLQYFCQVLPINYLIHQRKLLYWNKLFTSENCILLFLSRLVSQRFVAIGSLYGLSSIHVNQQTIKRAVWETFASTVE